MRDAERKRLAAKDLGKFGGLRESAGPAQTENARLLGRLGGLKGGKVRAERMTAEERSASASRAGKARLTTMSAKRRREIARLAVAARWAAKKRG